MNVSGVLVQVRPEKLGAVSAALTELPGVEVHQKSEDGRMVVTIEDEGARGSGDTLVKINLVDGVLAASLVYHHFEPNPNEPVRTGDHP